MKLKLHNIFEKARNLPLQKEVEEGLKRIGVDLVSIFENARQMTVKEAAKKSALFIPRNYMAEVMHGNAIGLLYQVIPQFMRKDKHNRAYIALGDSIRVYVKKLSPKRYTPSNIKTKHVNNMDFQTLFEDDEKVHVVYAGYVLDSNDWVLEFKEVCVSYLNRFYKNEAAWIINLRETEYRVTAHVTVIGAANTEEDMLVRVPGDQQVKKAL